MGTITIQEVLSSGVVTEIKIAGTEDGDKVLTSDEVEALITPPTP